MGLTAVPASQLPHAERAALWNDAFSDYFTPSAFTADTLMGFERAFDLDLDGSRVVLDEGRPVAFAMLGIRGDRGWIGGTGVSVSARRRGLGERVMNAVIDEAVHRSLSAVALEVLVENAPAIALYQKLTFATVRKLEVWDRAPSVAAPTLPDPAARPIPVAEAARLADAWRIAASPWQRDLPAARAAYPDLEAMVDADVPHALAIFRPTAERLGLLEVLSDPVIEPAARSAALDVLLTTMFARHPARLARLLNLPEGDDAGAALECAGASVVHRQWEMVLSL